MRRSTKKFKKIIKRVKKTLEVVKIWINREKFIDAKWLLMKVERFVNKRVIEQIIPELSMHWAFLKSKEYELKIERVKNAPQVGLRV